MKEKKEKVSLPQSENRWECKIRWEETAQLWMTNQEIFPRAGQIHQTSACSASQLTSKLNPIEMQSSS